MAGFDAICIASGPSLLASDVEYVRGRGHVYAINDVYRLAPWADALYACDSDWWDHHDGAAGFSGEKHTISQEAAAKWDLICHPYNPRQAFGKRIMATGGNSGFQAMNLAYLEGASRIVLLGYDMGYDRSTEKSHFFGDHPTRLQKNPVFAEWVEAFRRASFKIDIPVINCSRRTFLDCFPVLPLEEVL